MHSAKSIRIDYKGLEINTVFQCNFYAASKQVYFQIDTGFWNRLEIRNLDKHAQVLELEVLQIGQSLGCTRLCSDGIPCTDNMPLMEKGTLSLYFLSL